MFGISGIALVIIAVAIVVPSAGWWASSHNLQVCEADHSAFVTGVESVGVVADLDGKLKNMSYEKLKGESDNEINLARGSLLAYADKLRDSQKRTGRSLLPTPAPSTGNPERTDFDRSQLVDAMGTYTKEMGDIRREITELVTEGATAVTELDGAKKWAHGVNGTP